MVRRMKFINHQVEGCIAPSDLVLLHQDQMRATPHFIDGYLWPIENGTHSNGAHELRRFTHAVSFQHHMRDTDRGALLVHGDMLDARLLFGMKATSCFTSISIRLTPTRALSH